ncbi:nuclear protein MDM1 isoform X1 [Xiphophorus couchianus]|uniref:nuclear protein MDM1 isoform X1 n=1 Tax=Xiphophorus couchianus TaxID=32473 RepID=UPI0010160D4B|nr:nuclear protein MDM1 isoform X1 [Xiphophorus couchianus]
MTVRFKSQSEYQKSYGVPRSRSVSPQRCRPLAGFCPDQNRISRPLGLQPLKRPGPAESGDFLPGSPAAPVCRTAPSTGRKDSPVSKPPNASGSEPEPGSRPVADGTSVKLRPFEPGGPAEPEQQPGNQVGKAWGQRSEYHRQFGWKKPVPAASPLLTAEQVLHSSSRSIPPFKKNPVPMETEYRRSFQGLAPPSGLRLRRNLGHPVFHTYRTHRRKSLDGQNNKLPVKQETTQGDGGSRLPLTTALLPAQVRRRHRMLTEYQSSFRSPLCRNPKGGGATDDFTEQVKERRQQAQAYRRRAWGTNFSRDHLSQLLSEHNALWEPTDSHSDPSTPPPNRDLSPEPDSRSASCVEALDLASMSSRRSSVSGGKTQRNAGRETPPGPGAERHAAWAEEEEETEEEEGRLPTPRLKTRPVQRTHHDLTTPATGGAILVGKQTNRDDSSPIKQKPKFASPEFGSEVSINKPVKLKEAWPENTPMSLNPPPTNKQTPSPQPQPIRTKQAPPSPVAPPPLGSPPQHGIQGMLRHPDFQHNGDLGLRFRELPCSRGGCGSDEDDRLSVMSWRSAASCSAASAVLERAQKRREDFWGKR